MRKTLSQLLVVLLALGILCGAYAETDSEEITIGFLFCGFDTPSVQAGVNASKARADELGVNLIQLDGEFNAQVQADQALQLISMGVDAIIVNAAFTDAFTDLARQISEAGIPLLAWCQRLSPETDEYVDCFVGVDDTLCGPWAISAIEDAFADSGEEINVVEVRGALGSLCYNNRHDGFVNAIEDSSVQINLLETQVAESVNADEGQTIMENYLTKYDDIDVVYCVDDAVAAGVALAIEDAGMKGEIMTIGINGEPNAFDLIKDGHNYVTLKQHIEWSASEVVSAAYNIVNGEDVDWVIDEWEVVTAENVDSTTPAWPE